MFLHDDGEVKEYKGKSVRDFWTSTHYNSGRRFYKCSQIKQI